MGLLSKPPRLSLGLPVFNGEKHLCETLACLLGQSFTDFELIISDNASEDATEAICRGFAEDDERVCYFRQPRNRGAAYNHNFVIDQARAPLFRWSGHDDLCSNNCLEVCVDAVEADDGVVLAFCPSDFIDTDGELIGSYADGLDLRSRMPLLRLAKFIKNVEWTDAIYGVMCMSALKQTGRHRDFVSADRLFLAEMALLGKFMRVKSGTFYRRIHSGMCSLSHKSGDDLLKWYNPEFESVDRLKYRKLFDEEKTLIKASTNLRRFEKPLAKGLYVAQRLRNKFFISRNRRIRNRIRYAPGREGVYP